MSEMRHSGGKGVYAPCLFSLKCTFELHFRRRLWAALRFPEIKRFGWICRMCFTGQLGQKKVSFNERQHNLRTCNKLQFGRQGLQPPLDWNECDQTPGWVNMSLSSSACVDKLIMSICVCPHMEVIWINSCVLLFLEHMCDRWHTHTHTKVDLCCVSCFGTSTVEP